MTAVTSSKSCKNHLFLHSKRALTPPLNPPKARHSLGRPWESLWKGLEELWEAQGQLWEALAELWEALGELWEGLYIQKLPINRPSGRYVIYTRSTRAQALTKGG